MDGFGDNFVPNGNGSIDPAAEFLAREQDELAGLEDPPPVVPAVPFGEAAPDAAIAEADALQDAADEANYASAAAAAAATAIAGDVISTPVRTPERVVTPVPRVEPEAIKIWREEHQSKLIEKDAAEEKAKEALREKANQELLDWYKQHDEQVAKTRQANRCAEKELVADTERPEPGTEWERIAKLCDFNPKTSKSSRDVSRMRSIILHVKQSPPVKA
ncbi:Clathrin light chain [Trinorchestia longiramus]|nr:Clathrin light chain [Trinorchestia longiramus]